MEVPFGVVG